MEEEDKYLVLKMADIINALTGEQLKHLSDILDSISEHRQKTGRNVSPRYIVVNEDEPYADKVWRLIDGERT